MRAIFSCLLLLTSLFASAVNAADKADVTFYAAASLTNSLQDIGKAFEADTGKRVQFSFAASSLLARQIEAGAEADLFMSADSDWMDYLAQRSLILTASRRDLLGNRLVLIAPKDSNVQLRIEHGFAIAGALGDGRLAVADPDSVPAGKYARAALTALGVWNGVASRLVRAENVRVALAYVARGEAPLGIVYETDAKAEPNVKIVGAFPNDTHPPIVYPVALTAGSRSPDAIAFRDYLETAKASDIFREYGFQVLK